MFYNLFDDEDDALIGSPKTKWLEILFNANRDLVQSELEGIIQKMAVLEIMVAENGLEDEALEREVKNRLLIDDGLINNKIKSLYIESMGNILSQNE
jgi:hypothetical protein